MSTPYDPQVWGARCLECPLYKKARVVPPVFATKTADPLVLIGDCPDMQSAKAGKAMHGSAGVALDDVMMKAGMPRSNAMLVTYACLCRPEVPDESGKRRYDVKGYIAWLRKKNAATRKANKELVKLGMAPVPEHPSPFVCCAPRLENELQWAENAAKNAFPYASTLNLSIVPMGSFALGSVMGTPGKTVSISRYRGSVIPQEPKP